MILLLKICPSKVRAYIPPHTQISQHEVSITQSIMCQCLRLFTVNKMRKEIDKLLGKYQLCETQSVGRMGSYCLTGTGFIR